MARRGVMKAAIITAAGKGPVYGDFTEPVARAGEEIITVSASALSQFSRSRSSGSHYSSDGEFPAVAGAEGVGRMADGQRVYFVLPEAPYGALAERSLVSAKRCVPIPDGLDDVTAAAIANPGMSAWAGLVERAHLQRGETVLVNGATGTAGRLAVQLAKYLGAGKVDCDRAQCGRACGGETSGSGCCDPICARRLASVRSEAIRGNAGGGVRGRY